MGVKSYNIDRDNAKWLTSMGAKEDRSASWFLNKLLTDLRAKSEPKKKVVTKKFNQDDLKMAEWMWGRVLKLNPTAKKPSLDKWADVIRLMREIDGRTLQDIGSAFDWANKDTFWCSNILSPEKLRKQFDKLKVKANEANQPATNATGNRRLTAEEERNQELLRKYGHTTSPAERAINTDEHPGLDQRQVQRGIPEQVEQEGVTIDLDSGDWSSYGQSDSQGC